jgi:hypothetical protein
MLPPVTLLLGSTKLSLGLIAIMSIGMFNSLATMAATYLHKKIKI